MACTWRKILATEEIEQVARLARRIWPAVYAGMISPEQIRFMLDWMYAPDRIRREIHEGGVTWLHTLCDGAPVGYAAFGPIDGETRCPLHKLYVAPEWHRQGIGSLTISEIEARARRSGATSLELRVNRNNHPACALYRKCGFTLSGEDCAEIGGGFVMDDFIFRKSLPP